MAAALVLAPVLAPVTTPGHLALLPQVAYTHLDDNILTVIDLSDKKELAPAQAILQRIHARQLYKFLDQTQPTDERVAEAGLFDAVGTLACRTCFLCPVVSLLFVEPSFFHFVASVIYPSCARPALAPCVLPLPRCAPHSAPVPSSKNADVAIAEALAAAVAETQRDIALPASDIVVHVVTIDFSRKVGSIPGCGNVFRSAPLFFQPPFSFSSLVLPLPTNINSP